MGIYYKISRANAMSCKHQGAVISSSFTTLKGHGSEWKGRFVVNLSVQSKKWKAARLKNENLKDFVAVMKEVDCFLSFNV